MKKRVLSFIIMMMLMITSLSINIAAQGSFGPTPQQLKPTLAMPQVTIDSTFIQVGHSPRFSWDEVPNADFYTVWDWTRDKCYDNINLNQMFDTARSAGLPTMDPFTKPGVYAISVYARDKDGIYAQSEPPATFNITVVDGYAMTLYTEDGRSKSFYLKDIQPQLSVGWYVEPVQRLYAPGKSQVFPKSMVPAQLTVGWSTTPVR